MCHQINNHLWTEGDVSGDQSPCQSPAKKKDSEVRITDVKGVKVRVFEPQVNNTSLCVVDDLIVNANPDLYKVIRLMRPDSPDVIRAAKRLEQARSKEKFEYEQILEDKDKKSHSSAEVSARNKISR